MGQWDQGGRILRRNTAAVRLMRQAGAQIGRDLCKREWRADRSGGLCLFGVGHGFPPGW